MSQESAKRLLDDIVRIIDYYRKEFDLTYHETIGILTMIAMDLNEESRGIGGDDGESIEEGNEEA